MTKTITLLRVPDRASSYCLWEFRLDGEIIHPKILIMDQFSIEVEHDGVLYTGDGEGYPNPAMYYLHESIQI
jgi:hypothetical protein